MAFLDTLNSIKIPLPVIGTIGGVGLVAGLIILYLATRKKTVSFKV